jgi:OOP family OmpA-OmpF porin
MRPALPAAALAALLVLVPHEVGAQAPDVAGSRDHPLVGRYQGARIARYQERAFEEVRLIDKPLVAADGPRRGERNSRAVEGRQVRITYEGPAGRSALEMFRNHEQALAARGFESVFACAGTVPAARASPSSARSRAWPARRGCRR